MRSATGRSMAAYQTTLLSLRAASTSAGVTGLDSGAPARSGRASPPTAAAAAVLSTPLRVTGTSFMVFFPRGNPTLSLYCEACIFHAPALSVLAILRAMEYAEHDYLVCFGM
jgi:hypothetical protein